MDVKRKQPRTDIDFSNHELTVHQCDECLIHTLQQPETIIYKVVFINSNGVLTVTGDLYNWVFCREFHPSPEGKVSDHYWAEKAAISSRQQPKVYDADLTEAQIREDLAELDDYHGTEETKHKREHREFLEECLGYVGLSEFEYTSFAYLNFPSWTDNEIVPYVQRIDHSLLAVFDAFEEVCRRLKQQEEAT